MFSCWLRTWADKCLRTSSGRSWSLWAFVSRESCSFAHDDTRSRPLTPHFIVSVERGPEVVKLRSMTELCGLRVSVEKYIAPKGPLRCKLCQHFGRLSAADVYEIKQPTVGAV